MQYRMGVNSFEVCGRQCLVQVYRLVGYHFEVLDENGKVIYEARTDGILQDDLDEAVAEEIEYAKLELKGD